MSQFEEADEVVSEITDVMQGSGDTASQGRVIRGKKKKRPDFTDEERALILQWLEERYRDLYGRANSATVAQDRDEVWSDFLVTLNAVHEPSLGRTLEELVKKIDNMKTQGRSTCQNLFQNLLVVCNKTSLFATAGHS